MFCDSFLGSYTILWKWSKQKGLAIQYPGVFFSIEFDFFFDVLLKSLNAESKHCAAATILTSASSSSSFVLHRMNGGQSFTINDRTKFMDEVAVEFFPKQGRFRSFERQLNGWGFQRLESVAGKGSTWYHQCFVKNHPELLEHITRLAPSGKDANLDQAQAQIQRNVKAGQSMRSTSIHEMRATSSAYSSMIAQFSAHAAVAEYNIAALPMQLQSNVDGADDNQDNSLSSLDFSNPAQSRDSAVHAADIDTVLDNDFLSFLDDNDGVNTIFVDTVSSSKSGAHQGAPLQKSHIKCFPRGLHAVLNDAETMGHEIAISW